MVQKIKVWDAIFVSYRSEIIKTRTEEEAVAIAAAHVEPGERLSQVEEIEGEGNEKIHERGERKDPDLVG